jgi:hypothetical protein
VCEIPVSGNFNLLSDNHCIAPDCDVRITKINFHFLEQNSNTHTYRVISLGVFTASNYGWSSGTPLPIPYYGNKINRKVIHTTAWFLGLNQQDSFSNSTYQPWFF